jgi:hypothetical protein
MVTVESVIEPQEPAAHPKVVVEPVSIIQALLGLKLFMPLRNVAPLLVTVPAPKEFEEPIVKIALFTVSPAVKVFLPLRVVAAFIITEPVPAVALIISHEQREAALIVRVSVVALEPKAIVPDPIAPPLPRVTLLPFVASVPLLILIDDGVKTSVEPDALAIVAVPLPDTVRAPVTVISPSKVAVYPVFKVQGLGTVIADDAVRVPPIAVKVLELEPSAEAELTVKLLPELRIIPPENVLVPDRLTAPAILSVPVLPDKSAIVPAKVVSVEATKSMPSKAIVPVLALSVFILILEVAVRSSVTPLSILSVVKLRVVPLLFTIFATSPEDPLTVAAPKENVEQEWLLQAKVVVGGELAFVAVKTQGLDVVVNVLRAELTVVPLLVTVLVPKAEADPITRVPLSKNKPPEKVLTPLKVKDDVGDRSITTDPDPGDRSPITPAKEVELVDAMVNVPSIKSFPAPEPKPPSKITGSPEIASMPSVVAEIILREENFKLEDVSFVICAKPVVTPLGSCVATDPTVIVEHPPPNIQLKVVLGLELVAFKRKLSGKEKFATSKMIEPPFVVIFPRPKA